MGEFVQQDLSGSRFEQVDLSGATLREVQLTGAHLAEVDLRDLDVRGAYLSGHLRGLAVSDLQLNGEFGRLVVNGVDVTGYVADELNRRHPERALLTPDDPQGFRTAFAAVEQLWAATVDRARTLPPDDLHRSVDGEWSFVQTLRHLGFATMRWAGMVVGERDPWHPLDLPCDGPPPLAGVPCDREARPSLEEVLAVRAQRRALVHRILDRLTPAELEREVSAVAVGQPDGGPYTVAVCLTVVLNEEWCHHLFAERDLAVIEAETQQA